MSSLRTNRFRRRARWLLPAALLALTPKCVLCVLAYAGLGTALGLSGPEICGGPIDTIGSWTTSFALGGLVLGVISFVSMVTYHRRCRATN